MTRIVAEADCKVLRRVYPLALERCCERVLAEIEHVTHISSSFSRETHIEMPLGAT